MDSKPAATSIDEYIAAFPESVQEKLQQVRETIHATVPEATEKISYGMPTFYLNGNVVHFAAFQSHIGFYPAPQGLEAFKDELARYKGGKGSVQFPLDQPLPLDLIRRITEFRAEGNRKKANPKARKSKE